MEVALLVVGVPLAAALVAGVPLYFVSSRWLVRTWNATVAAQVVIVLSAWLVLAAAPDDPNSRGSTGSTCPNLEGGHGHALVVLGFVSIAVGAFCLASAVLAAHRRASGAGRVLIGLAASAAPLAVFVPLVFAVFCGWG